jgi:hypothetical protein
VLKQISPVVVPILPIAFPVNLVPSSRISSAVLGIVAKVRIYFGKNTKIIRHQSTFYSKINIWIDMKSVSGRGDRLNKF